MAPAKISLALALNLLVKTTSGPAQEMLGSGSLYGADQSVGVLDLHHRPVVEEQSGQADRFGKRAAAVAAQVEHDRIDALALEVVENVVDVAGGALEVLDPAAGAFHVHVEAGQVDDADLVRLAVGLAPGVEYLAVGFAVL